MSALTFYIYHKYLAMLPIVFQEVYSVHVDPHLKVSELNKDGDLFKQKMWAQVRAAGSSHPDDATGLPWPDILKSTGNWKQTNLTAIVLMCQKLPQKLNDIGSLNCVSLNCVSLTPCRKKQMLSGQSLKLGMRLYLNWPATAMIQSICLYHQEMTTKGSLLRCTGPKPSGFDPSLGR